MANIDITDQGSTLNNGVLQLENGVAMDTTLRYVADQLNTKSQLLLATNATTVEGTLKIKTANVEYLDVEDTLGNNRFTISKAVGSQKVDLDFASNPTSPTDIVGGIRTFQNGVNLSDSLFFRKNGQATFTERVNVEGDSSVTTQTSSVIQSSTTNASLVIAPNGTGALVASIPDGTATGGNARGNNAVDLQTSRSSNLSVASGTRSVVLGGSNNSARATESVCVGGSSNNAQQLQSFIGGGNSNLINGGTENAIVGGTLNINSGVYGFIGAGFQNVVSSGYSTISGGQSNTASTNTHATVVGGQSNTSSGQWAISGGQSSTASATRTISLGASAVANANGAIAISAGAGNQTTASGISSVSIGNDTLASGRNSLCTGYFSNAYLYGQKAHSGNFIGGAVAGNCQYSELNPFKLDTLTTGATTVLSLDGTGTTNLIIPTGTNRMWNVQVRWVAVVTAITGTAAGVTVGDTKTSTDLLAVAKRAGSTTVSAHTSAGTHAIETVAGSLTAANITYSAGASQEMAITFTGPTFAGGGSVTMRVVAAISLTEVAY